MSNKIEISRELALDLEYWLALMEREKNVAGQCVALNQLREAIAAPAVERQEPVAYRIIYNDGEASGWMNGKPAELDVEDVATGVLRAIELAYTSPPAPVAVVLPTLISSEDGPHYSDNRASECGYLAGFNACLDKVKELNS